MFAAGDFQLLPSGLPRQAESLLEAHPDASLGEADLEYLAAANNWEPDSPGDDL
jgi:hypothetical protein